MTMSDAPMAILSIVVGMVLGTVYFGGLWWTVRRVIASSHPGLLMLVSMLGRTALVVAGFYAVSGGEWRGLLFCLAGFVVARFAVIRLLPRAETALSAGQAEVSSRAS